MPAGGKTRVRTPAFGLVSYCNHNYSSNEFHWLGISASTL